jgi:hypothetical protein
MNNYLEDDRVWGSVLIAIGIASVIFRPFEKVDKALHGETDAILTAILLVLATATVWLAFWGRPAMKALAIVWIVTP